MKELTPPPGTPDPVPVKTDLRLGHRCYKDAAKAPVVETTDEGDAR